MTGLARYGNYAECMDTLPPPQLRFFANLRVTVSTPCEVGKVVHGLRRVIPITGGEVEGASWRGRVLQGGADFQLIAGETLVELDARYVLEAEGGQRIYVHNLAIRSAPAQITAKIARGEPVDPAQVYFRCMPRFETAWPEMAWLNERMFVGTAARFPDHVQMSVFEMV